MTTAERGTRLRIKTVVEGPDVPSRLVPLGDFDLPAPGQPLRAVIPEHLRIQDGG